MSKELQPVNAQVPRPVTNGAGFGQYQSPPADESAAEFDWRIYAEATIRHKWLVLGIVLAATAGGVMVARSLAPTYEAHISVWIDAGDPRSRDPEPILTTHVLSSSGWQDLVKELVVLDDVVREQRLFITAHGTDIHSVGLESLEISDGLLPGVFRLTADRRNESYTLEELESGDIQEAPVGSALGEPWGFQWTPSPELVKGNPVEFTLRLPSEAALSLSHALQPRVDRDGNLMRLTLRGTRPARVASTLNAVADRFVEVAASLKRQKLTELTSILETQTAEAERQLQRAEAALKSYRARTAGMLAHGGSPSGPLFQTYLDSKVSYDRVRSDRQAVERLLAASEDSAPRVQGLEFIPSVREAPELSRALEELTEKRSELWALERRYTAEHPPVQRLRGEVNELAGRTIPDLARSLVVELRQREDALGRQVDSSTRVFQEVSPLAVEEAQLEREVQLAAQFHGSLFQRLGETRLAEMSSIPDVRLLDRAVTPRRPIRNFATLVVVGAFVGGLGLGVVSATVMDRIDPKFQRPDQVQRELGLSILGVLPHISTGRGANATGPAQIVESLRGIRLNLSHAYGAAGPLVVTITSPGSGDGKSFVSSNLALAFAEAGHRTLLIDGDVRRGSLNKALKVPRQPGLTDYLSGRAPREEIVLPTEYQSVFFVPSGTRMQSAPELLTSAAMSQFLMELRSSYGVIIVDSAPLAAGVDSLVLGSLCSNMLLVLRKGATDLAMAQAKLEVLDRLPIRILGAVLNDVDVSGRDRFYGYYSYYLPGYEAHDEKSGEDHALPAATQTST